jgi:hypothetical protein
VRGGSSGRRTGSLSSGNATAARSASNSGRSIPAWVADESLAANKPRPNCQEGVTRMYSVLIISKSHLDRDPRVYKQVLYLKEDDGFRVATIGIRPTGLEDEFYGISGDVYLSTSFSFGLLAKYVANAVRLKLRRYEARYWSDSRMRAAYDRFRDAAPRFDLVVANDLPVLPLALRIAEQHSAKVYLDAHEYEPLHYNHFWFNFLYRDYWRWICKRYLPAVDHMTTVSDGIAREYSTNFGVKCDVMMNLPFYADIEPTNRRDGRIRLIHHGAATKRRQLENMIELMKHLDDRFELDFMMLNMDSMYGRYLREISASDRRIRFVPPVAMRDIPRAINPYDVGLFLLPPNTFNHRMVLPNKIFEYIQGRLAVAIWPSQEMVKVVDRYQNGVCSRDFDILQMASMLNSLTDEDIVRMKRNSHLAARELNSEKVRDQLREIVRSLLAQ